MPGADATDFPVLQEMPLTRAARRWFGRREWAHDELPGRPPGSVFVFFADGEYHVRHHDGPLRTGEGHLAAASTVLLVDLRPRMLYADIGVMRVGFRCRVMDAVTVARNGYTDLSPELTAYLHQNERVRWLAIDLQAHQLLQQRLRAQFATAPLEIPGMDVQPTTITATQGTAS